MDLHKDFTEETFFLGQDHEGSIEATFISCNQNTGNQKSILYIHGYIDYFFHPHLAQAFTDAGWDFYALDLRRYGRSLRDYQTPNYCENMEEYFEEIDLCIDKISSKVNLSLLGHSTGGLLASLYMLKGKHKNRIDQLILNSPFLEMNAPKILAKVGYVLSKIMVKFSKSSHVNFGVSPIYPESIHKDYKGSWDFNLKWKPIEGFPVYFSWFKAVYQAQREVQKGKIHQPVILMHSDKSFLPKKFTDKVMCADIVLNVEDMKRIAPNMSEQVRLIEIPDGQHDLFLSQEKPRNLALNQIKSF